MGGKFGEIREFEIEGEKIALVKQVEGRGIGDCMGCVYAVVRHVGNVVVVKGKVGDVFHYGLHHWVGEVVKAFPLVGDMKDVAKEDRY